MKRCLLVPFAAMVLLAPAPTTGAPVPKMNLEDRIKEDLSRLEGRWRVVSYQKNGVERPPQQLANMQELTFSGRNFTWGDSNTPSGSIADIDPTASPKSISYKYASETLPADFGIYMIEGDVFMDCFGTSEKDRPTSFTSKPDSGQTLVVYKRVRKDEK